MNGYIQLLMELESSCLEVGLVPLDPNKRGWNEGGCRRCCLSRNARWYRQFCERHLSSRARHHRKPDTKIKRRNIIQILNRIIEGKPTTSKYAAELRKLTRKVA